VKEEPRAAGSTAPRNRLLAQLGTDEWARLSPHLELVQLSLRQILYDIDRPIGHVYFVEEGVVSIVAAGLDGQAVETGTVGNEGMVGLPVIFGSDTTSAQAFCQVPGAAYRMGVGELSQSLLSGGRLAAVIRRYALAFLTQTGQGSACNRLHSIRQRCARWLLECHDRVSGDTFQLTHEFLSQMLGVRRATVSEIAGQLQREAIIAYEYGRITILDRTRLEEAACECYAIIWREFQRLVERHEVPSVFEGRRTAAAGRTVLQEPDLSVA
jgi:CRP-like cAMP-binding protein